MMERSRQSLYKFVVGGVALVLTGIAWAEDAALVNGTAISTQDVDAAFRRTSVSRRQLTEKETKLYRRHVLNVLVNDCLLNQFLLREKVATDEKKVDNHIAEIRQQLQSKGKTLESFLDQMNIDEKKMRDDIRNMYRWIAYVESQATDKTLHAYFEANRAAVDGSEVRASHILVKVEPDATTEQRQAARRKIESIRAQLVSGTSFAEAARTFSDCPSKEQGGDLGFFVRKGMMSEPFAAAAFSLAAGQVSEVVETEFGYHLIVVTERKPGKAVAFEKVLDELKGAYAEDLRQTIIAQMRQGADIKLLR